MYVYVGMSEFVCIFICMFMWEWVRVKIWYISYGISHIYERWYIVYLMWHLSYGVFSMYMPSCLVYDVFYMCILMSLMCMCRFYCV